MQATKINPTGTTIGGRLFGARKAQSISLAAAAAKIGCHRSYLSKLERGTSNRPSVDFLRKAAAAFGVNDIWLETGFGTPLSEGEEDKSLETPNDILTGLTDLLRGFSLDQVLALAGNITANPNLTPTRRATWLRILAPFITEKSRSEGEDSEGSEFVLAPMPDIQNKWRLKVDSVVSHWQALRERVQLRTLERGQRAALARLMKVSPQALNEWLQGRSAPPAEQALRLLQWVEQQAGKEIRAGSASTQPALKTRKSKSNEKAKSNPKRK